VVDNAGINPSDFVYAYRFGCDSSNFKEIINGTPVVIATAFADMNAFFARPSMYQVLQI